MGPSHFADEPEHIGLLRHTLQRFVSQEMPSEAVRQWDREHRFPRDLFQKLAALGVCGLTIEEEYGGQGRDLVAAGPFIHCAFYGGMNISENGSVEQKRELLPKLARGELLFAYGLSEGHDMERHVRDILGMPIVGGSSNMQKNNIANRLGLAGGGSGR